MVDGGLLPDLYALARRVDQPARCKHRVDLLNKAQLGAAMESGKAHEIFIDYHAAMAYIEVELPSGDRSIGSAFHVGEGVFVTARHVVEGNTILEIATTEGTYIPLAGVEAENARTVVVKGGKRIPSHHVSNGAFTIDTGPLFHPRDDVDVAVFRVRDIDPYTPFVQLGGHLDDWLGQEDFVLSEAIVLGYPPVPMTAKPILIGARAEVNAQADLYDAPNVHFILSAMPRGGFSGGVAISEYGYALGVITRSLNVNHGPVETGFMAVTGVEPIYECLADHHLLPDAQAGMWDGLWNTNRWYFSHPDFDPTGMPKDIGGYVVAASVAIFDDGKKYTLTIACHYNQEAGVSAVTAAESALSEYQHERSDVQPGTVRIDVLPHGVATSAAVQAAAQAMSVALENYGFEAQGSI